MAQHLRVDALAPADLFHQHADELLRAVEDKLLHRLFDFAIHLAGDDGGFSHGQFVTFTPHRLNQNGQLQFAAAEHFE